MREHLIEMGNDTRQTLINFPHQQLNYNRKKPQYETTFDINNEEFQFQATKIENQLFN